MTLSVVEPSLLILRLIPGTTSTIIHHFLSKGKGGKRIATFVVQGWYLPSDVKCLLPSDIKSSASPWRPRVPWLTLELFLWGETVCSLNSSQRKWFSNLLWSQHPSFAAVPSSWLSSGAILDCPKSHAIHDGGIQEGWEDALCHLWSCYLLSHRRARKKRPLRPCMFPTEPESAIDHWSKWT